MFRLKVRPKVAVAASVLSSLCALSLFGAGGCGLGPPRTPDSMGSPLKGPEGTFARDPQDRAVSVYVSKKWGFSTSSYFIEGPSGLVMIDMQFLPSAADEAIHLAQNATHKNVVAGIALHANPDKFNGATQVRGHGGKALTSSQVLELIPHIHEIRHTAFYERYKPDYPNTMPKLESFGDRDMTLEVAGVSLGIHILGAGCSESHVVITWKHHVFVGDLVANGFHSWLEIGKTDEWLKRLSEIRALGATRVHPGRGPSGDASLLAKEEDYLRTVISLVAAENPTNEEDDAGVSRAIAAVEKRFPKLDAPVFLRIGIPAEWARQARLRKAAPR